MNSCQREVKTGHITNMWGNTNFASVWLSNFSLFSNKLKEPYVSLELNLRITNYDWLRLVDSSYLFGCHEDRNGIISLNKIKLWTKNDPKTFWVLENFGLHWKSCIARKDTMSVELSRLICKGNVTKRVCHVPTPVCETQGIVTNGNLQGLVQINVRH